MVFIAVAQQRIVGRYLVDEVDGGAWQVDHVDVYKIKRAAGEIRAVSPFVSPCAAGDHTCVFRTFLAHESDGEFGRRPHFLFETAPQEWRLECGEGDAEFSSQLGVAVVYKAVEIA